MPLFEHRPLLIRDGTGRPRITFYLENGGAIEVALELALALELAQYPTIFLVKEVLIGIQYSFFLVYSISFLVNIHFCV